LDNQRLPPQIKTISALRSRTRQSPAHHILEAGRYSGYGRNRCNQIAGVQRFGWHEAIRVRAFYAYDVPRDFCLKAVETHSLEINVSFG
jgi:hypothetical protein